MLSNLYVFRKFSSSYLSSLNSKIRSSVQQGCYREVLRLHSTLIRSSLKPDRFIFPSLLKACAGLLDLTYGRKTHAAIVEMGLQSDPYIASALIKMYVKCGSLSEAFHVFDKTSERDVTVWNSMIDGCFWCGCEDEGLFLFRQMQLLSIRPDGYSLSIVLGTCRSRCSGIEHGKQIHAYVIRNVLDRDPFLGTSLIDMYSKCERPFDALRVFDRLIVKNASTWNAVIGGFCLNGWLEKSLELFVLMKNERYELGFVTFSSVLTACSHGEAVIFGKGVHGDIIKAGFEYHPFVCTSILTMYAKCGLIEDAYKVFDKVQVREIELWNAMISAYVGTGNIDEALDIYIQMRLSGLRSDSFTISNVLSACSMNGLFNLGSRIHGELIKRPVQSNMTVQSAVLTMYARCGNLDAAKSVFDTIQGRDVIAWGSMIVGACQNRKFEEALDLFKAMEVERLEPDSTIMVSIINAYTGLESAKLGFQIHGHVIKSGNGMDVYINCALIDMYAKFGLPELAGIVFSSMTCKNLVAWNSIISCYARNSCPDLAVNLFLEISHHGLIPDSISVTSVLVAVSSLAALLMGKTIHGFHIRHEIQSDLHVDNALVDMYTKCGCLQYARSLFDIMPHKNIVTWNSMISGYGSHGHCSHAIELFNEMQKLEVSPDDITFLALISSCSHSGLVEVGHGLFHSMSRDHKIVPRIEHYANMVDLYGRAGRLDEAYNFIESMPIKPDESVWLCFLSSCRAHRQLELGELAANCLLKLDPERSGNYVQLLNLYGEAGLWEKAADLRALMKERGLKKSPGYSWIEVKDRVDVFSSGDSSSPWTAEIHATLKSLKRIMDDGCHEIVSI
ncbi:pentatricopeptide repeat-containing protein At2g40720-like [Magnolia sinica]|uniref:pentatricopeptide repeat-containing protein At2g40720-like n=1 Tax=Magnolia sinica TaxID=86752 RepID=UPI0026598633|nr:pentatricopeptide repeat-containing protein At2g40720-like [Magnolia sinica]